MKKERLRVNDFAELQEGSLSALLSRQSICFAVFAFLLGIVITPYPPVSMYRIQLHLDGLAGLTTFTSSSCFGRSQKPIENTTSESCLALTLHHLAG